MATIMSGLFQWQNSSSWIHGDDFDVSFRLTKFVLINSWSRLCRVFFSDKILPHEFIAMILTCLFDWQNSSSLIHGDDYVASFSVTKFVLINSWRRLCRVFFSDKIRPHEFMATILTCLFDWQNSSSLIHGADYVESFSVTKFFLMNS